MDEHISKPIDIGELNKAILRIFGGSQYKTEKGGNAYVFCG